MGCGASTANAPDDEEEEPLEPVSPSPSKPTASKVDSAAPPHATTKSVRPVAQVTIAIRRRRPPQPRSGVPATASLTDAEKRCKTAITSILAGLADSEEKYEDATWSPNEDEANVLYVDGEKPSHDCSVEAPDSWTRLGELSDAPVLISDRIKATDVQQGSIGDCFLLSAIAAVAAARRELVRSLFVAYDISKGVYGVRLFLNGTWDYVIVDDLVAVDDEGDKLYAKCEDVNELWLPVLEKAIAKACCAYENLDGGFTEWALEVITGGLADPRDKLEVESLDPLECWQRVRALLQRGDVLAVSTYSDDDYEEKGFEFTDGEGKAGEGMLACGLVGGHAYALLGVAEFGSTKLYKIRNPWGSGEWTGAWADESEEMSEEAKAALGVTVEDDGVFYMSTADFSVHWEEVASVRLWDPSWSVTSTMGYFYRGTKLAVAMEDYEADEEDELGFEEGDTIVLTDCQGSDWWWGYKQPGEKKSRSWFGWRRAHDEEPEPLTFPRSAVKLDGGRALRKFQITAAEETEAVLVLLQPDLQARRSFVYSREHKSNEKVSDYPLVTLSVHTDPGGEEEVASNQGEERKVLVSVKLGPTPLFVSVDSYGGAGDKFQLLAYAHSSATITALGDSGATGGDEDKARAAFAHYDVDGDGALSRDEIAKILLELDLLSDLDVDEQREYIDEEFEAISARGEPGTGDDISLEQFIEWYRTLTAPDDSE